MQYQSANLSAYIEQFWSQQRKVATGRHLHSLATGQPLVCNPGNASRQDPLALRDGEDGASTGTGAGLTATDPVMVSGEEAGRSGTSARVQRAVLVFKVQALEKRIYSKVYDSPPGGSRRKSARRQGAFPVYYRATLPLYDADSSSGELELAPGNYELRMEVDHAAAAAAAAATEDNDSVSAGSSNGGAVVEWHPLDFPASSPAAEEYAKWPRLQFRVVVGRGTEEGGAVTTNGESIDKQSTTTMNNQENHCKEDTTSTSTGTTVPAVTTNKMMTGLPSTASGVSVSYRFLYHGRMEQWSQVADLLCPWCRRDFGKWGVRALLHHLRTWHPRFHFRESGGEKSGKLRVEVRVSRDSSGGLAGHDAGLRRHRRGLGGSRPVRRCPGTFYLYCRPAKQTYNGDGGTNGLINNNNSMKCSQKTSSIDTMPAMAVATSQQLQKDQEMQQLQKQLVAAEGGDWAGRRLALYYRANHTRDYCHTWSALPIRLCEFDEDSEDEETLEWLHEYYSRNINEFTDVNTGEKRVMQLWNSHLIYQRTLGDCQVSSAMTTFIAEQGPTLLREGLRTNLLLHLANLADYGLVSPETLVTEVAKLEASIATA